MARDELYIETWIDADMEALWAATQDPDEHDRWDLRFTDIDYRPRPDESEPQQFDYETRIGFGIGVAGGGESTGERADGGERTSSLRFWSDDPKSLITEGNGFWKYVPENGGVRFLTGHRRSAFLLSAGLTVVMVGSGLVARPDLLAHPLSSVPLGVAMLALAAIGYAAGDSLPSARRCITGRSESELQ